MEIHPTKRSDLDLLAFIVLGVPLAFKQMGYSRAAAERCPAGGVLCTSPGSSQCSSLHSLDILRLPCVSSPVNKSFTSITSFKLLLYFPLLSCPSHDLHFVCTPAPISLSGVSISSLLFLTPLSIPPPICHRAPHFFLQTLSSLHFPVSVNVNFIFPSLKPCLGVNKFFL